MEAIVRGGRSLSERRLDRSFEAERVQEEVWAKVYESIWPLVGRLRNVEGSQRPLFPMAFNGRKGA